MAWYWQKKRHKDQWNRIKNPQDIHGQLIFNKPKHTIEKEKSPQ